MNTSILIKSILSLPEKFHVLGNASIYSLLKETGYFEINSQINEATILDELNKHPEYINYWLNWSDDKRTTSGWYFKQNENGKYVVGYFPVSEQSRLMEYSDLKDACAAFIKREIEEIRNS
ncbi:hypothetical protein [Flavobacterium sp. CAU 1735]|uniref:hypothetical protein n=1 Tax=Flavobacterium sp. CAU 1735 TaxID=3140361 RepID=UPI00326194E6